MIKKNFKSPKNFEARNRLECKFWNLSFIKILKFQNSYSRLSDRRKFWRRDWSLWGISLSEHKWELKNWKWKFFKEKWIWYHCSARRRRFQFFILSYGNHKIDTFSIDLKSKENFTSDEHKPQGYELGTDRPTRPKNSRARPTSKTGFHPVLPQNKRQKIISQID